MVVVLSTFVTKTQNKRKITKTDSSFTTATETDDSIVARKTIVRLLGLSSLISFVLSFQVSFVLVFSTLVPFLSSQERKLVYFDF